MSSHRQTKPKNQSQKKGGFNPLWLAIPALGVVILAIGAIVLSNRGDQQSVSQALPDEISVAQALDKREAGAYMLDVREPDEWNEFNMPGATLIPLGELASRVDEVPKDREVVVVCRSGNRSATGRDILKEAGFSQVTSMAGGMNEWRSAGYPSVSGP